MLIIFKVMELLSFPGIHGLGGRHVIKFSLTANNSLRQMSNALYNISLLISSLNRYKSFLNTPASAAT